MKEPSVIYLSVSQQSESREDDSFVEEDDDDETPESRSYSKAMHNVIVRKPKRYGKYIIAAAVVFLLSAVGVGVALLIVTARDSKKLPVEGPSTDRPPETSVPSTHSSSTASTLASASTSASSPFSPAASTGSVNIGTVTSPAVPLGTTNSTAPVATTPTPSPFGLCWKGDSDCPVCSDGHNESFTTHVWLANSSKIVQSVDKSQHLMRQVDDKDVIEYRPLVFLHTTLNYFCCHTANEKRQIIEILHNQTWMPVNITYNATSCNLDHDNVTIYMLALLSNSSQDFLFNFVHHIENDMKTHAIPVNNPRKQPFHLTLALVNHSFPVDKVVKQLHHDIPVFGSIEFDHFYATGDPYPFTPSNIG